MLSFRKALALNSKLFVPNLFLGIDLTDAGSPREAIPYLLAAETLSPADVQAPLALARAYAASQRTLDAGDAYTRALSINPSNSDAWFGLGMMSLRQVEADTRRLISESPKSTYLASLQALVFSEEGKLPQATEQYKALLASPGAPYCSQVEYALVLARQQASVRRARLNDSKCAIAPLARINKALRAGDIQRCLERSVDPRPAESRSIESQHGPSLDRTLSAATRTGCRFTWQRHFSTSRRCAGGPQIESPSDDARSRTLRIQVVRHKGTGWPSGRFERRHSLSGRVRLLHRRLSKGFPGGETTDCRGGHSYLRLILGDQSRSAPGNRCARTSRRDRDARTPPGSRSLLGIFTGRSNSMMQRSPNTRRRCA